MPKLPKGPSGHLQSRAWTSQERGLATRILHYCEEQMYWAYVCFGLSESKPYESEFAEDVSIKRTARKGRPGHCDEWYGVGAAEEGEVGDASRIYLCWRPKNAK